MGEERFLSAQADAFPTASESSIAGANAEEKSRPAPFEMTGWSRDGATQPTYCAEGVRFSAFSVGEGGCVVHRLWRLSLAGEAGGVSQRLLSGVRGGAAGSAGAD